MINGTFRLGGDVISIKIEGNGLYFFDIGSGQVAPIEGIKLSKAGVLKEHPDLKNDLDWRKKAIERLKKHMNTYKTEMDKLLYVKKELEKFGYEPLQYAKAGFRPEKFKHEE